MVARRARRVALAPVASTSSRSIFEVARGSTASAPDSRIVSGQVAWAVTGQTRDRTERTHLVCDGPPLNSGSEARSSFTSSGRPSIRTIRSSRSWLARKSPAPPSGKRRASWPEMTGGAMSRIDCPLGNSTDCAVRHRESVPAISETEDALLSRHHVQHAARHNPTADRRFWSSVVPGNRLARAAVPT